MAVVKVDIVAGSGYVDAYDCDCRGDPNEQICWVVRYPNITPPISYDCLKDAVEALVVLRLTYDIYELATGDSVVQGHVGVAYAGGESWSVG